MEEFKNIAGRPTITKDPAAVLDYEIDFSKWLNSTDFLLTVNTQASEVTVDSSMISEDRKKVTLWVSGGTEGALGTVQIHFTTDQGRTDERTIGFQLKQR